MRVPSYIEINTKRRWKDEALRILFEMDWKTKPPLTYHIVACISALTSDATNAKFVIFLLSTEGSDNIESILQAVSAI